MWLENAWDHKFLVWEQDKLINSLYNLVPHNLEFDDAYTFQESIVWLPFNPTAENMAQYLVEVIGPLQLIGTGVVLTKCSIEETRKCSASFSL